MKNLNMIFALGLTAGILGLSQCTQKSAKDGDTDTTMVNNETAAGGTEYAGYESQEKWGEHLVLIGACHDCHTPKKMGPMGPEPDMTLMLSGHPASMPAPDIDRGMVESKGLAVTQSLTSWVGPWGVSYAANLTPDSTGTGAWKESNFITAIRKGKFKGIETGRDLLPPMPWQMYRNMSDGELKAVFAYLRSIKPIKNVVPQPQAPVNLRR